MKNTKHKIFGDYIICTDLKYENIKNLLNEYDDIAVVCFENDYSEDKYYIELLNENFINKVILIGSKPKSCFGERLIITNKIKEKFFRECKRIVFIINTDIDEEVLLPVVQMFDIAKKRGLEIGVDNVLGFSSNPSNILIKSLEALAQENMYKRYEVIYDYICDELDKCFADNSICKFEGNRCIANRKSYNRDKIMGCCYSFKYNGIQFSDVKLCEHQKNHKCDVKCLGCKLFTCDYLKKHGIRFRLKDMPIALAFFNKKQREILRTTFFVSKEEVLNKVINGK